jgi:hypothetical protein
MYTAKRNGRGISVYYEPSLEEPRPEVTKPEVTPAG